MHTPICDTLGIEFPIFAFSHCRDVVAAVSKAGGFGVLGAVGFSPQQLEVELNWIDEHIGDKPYGVDIVIPGKYEGMGEVDPAKLEQMLLAAIPEEHRKFADKLLEDHGVPKLPAGEQASQLLGWTAATATPQVEVALKHPRVKLIANALGTPPEEIIRDIHASGRLVAALCGAAKQAKAHQAAGVDIIIAQGTEGGGHTGDVGSMVLWPEVIEAAAPTPVLAAGGVGSGAQIAAALAMGAQGVWTGTLWLTVQEADVPPAQRESYLAAGTRDTVRSRSWTGKPCRMLRNDWTDAWEGPDSPGTLGMPLQFMVTADAVSRGHRYADKAKKVMFNPAGQIIGRIHESRSVRDVMNELVTGYVEAVERLQALTPGA
jgi:NAD(P)H-dependent flavin oxidoreductase YrpB (nitropropane dioxygenase family)